MAQYRTIKKFYYVPEATYGTTPTTALTWGCEIDTFKPTVDWQTEMIRTSGRDVTDFMDTALKVAMTLKGRARAVSGAYDWTNLFAVYGMGATTGLADTLGSFTCQTCKVAGANTFYNFYSGCKINNLQISTEGPGKDIAFTADIIAQAVAASTSKTISGIQALTVGADPTDITTSLLTWSGISQINVAGGGLTNWHPRRWTFAIDNHLEPWPQNKTGADSANYAFEAGQLPESDRDITLEVELPHETETLLNANIAKSAITAVTFPIGNKTLTLTNGRLIGGNSPELKQSLLSETLKFQFKTLSIA